jgi:hypothetical protein|tara:strand:+ start:2047 stop:2553 length:507 start_codon:yes stop_codon:yes gene_type:complete
MAEDNNLFNAPIPGQSLTAEPGARPWQQPSQFPTVEEAFEFYVKRITDPDINDSLFDALEMGTPVTAIAEIIVQSGVMEGKHTIDVSIQILPVLMELIAYLAEEMEIDYNMGMAKKIDQDVIPESKIALAVSKMKEKMPEEKNEMPMVEPEAMPEESAEPTGLMSRRV